MNNMEEILTIIYLAYGLETFNKKIQEFFYLN
jgi:hypothetical protein